MLSRLVSLTGMKRENEKAAPQKAVVIVSLVHL
uniref:Uncharacterized protein n=1 Tax=Rhizophora mucronata TaxID=61149 RepID=A0A2P2P086_RHIMU